MDVEGSEEAVLRGIRSDHWPRIQQLVLEVENFAACAAIRSVLERHGFVVSQYATEREKNPTATSEVSMMYASRPGYRPPSLGPALKGQAEGKGQRAASSTRRREKSRGASRSPAKSVGGAGAKRSRA